MRVLEQIQNTIRTRKMHMTLIDPASQSAERVKAIADIAARLGTDAFMVGGTTGVTEENLEATIGAMKSVTPRKPVIHFPTGANVLSPSCDAIYFMSFLNSKSIKNVVGEQVAAAPIIKEFGIEPIPMGYLVIEPGMKVGEVGEAKLITREDIEGAKAHAIATEFFGMKILYLEAGSGADRHVPEEMVRAVRNEITIPLIVGGGIRDGKAAKALADAGADILVTGTLIEEGGFEDRLREILEAIR